MVFSTLRQKLNSMRGCWLPCIDNTDNQEVNAIVGELFAIANAHKSQVWMTFTSRQGGDLFSEGMIADQKLRLQPLDKEHAMLLFWQRKTS